MSYQFLNFFMYSAINDIEVNIYYKYMLTGFNNVNLLKSNDISVI